MPRILGTAAVAGRFPLPSLWRWPIVAGARRAAGVRWLRLPNFSDSRDDLPGYPYAVAGWFRFLWWVTTQKNGASALGLQRVLGPRSYETAWTWLHKVRRAMVRPGRDLLTGGVEVDETYVGGEEEGLSGWRNLKKALVVVAVQQDGPGIGRFGCDTSSTLRLKA
jgi:hypothetical protein